jgi:hypothetical protein
MGAEGMEEDGDEDEEGNSAEQRVARSSDAGARPPIYNAEGMHEKLEDICWPSEVPYPSASVYYSVKCNVKEFSSYDSNDCCRSAQKQENRRHKLLTGFCALYLHTGSLGRVACDHRGGFHTSGGCG